MHDLVYQFINESEDNRYLYSTYSTLNNGNYELFVKKFSDFLFKIRISSYLHKTIFYSAFEFRKKDALKKIKEDLSLNVIAEGFNEEVINTIADTRDDIINEFYGEDNIIPLREVIENRKLLSVVLSLTPRQQKIIYMYFVLEIPEKKIAEQLGVSVQSINKIKKTALNNLKLKMGVK